MALADQTMDLTPLPPTAFSLTYPTVSSTLTFQEYFSNHQVDSIASLFEYNYCIHTLVDTGRACSYGFFHLHLSVVSMDGFIDTGLTLTTHTAPISTPAQDTA